MSASLPPQASGSAPATSSVAAAASASSSSGSLPQLPSSFKTVGVILAIASGVLIGSSFVFKKKGLLRSQAGGEAGQGVAYLKSFMWWTGMIMMILGEFCNFAAYAFVPAVVVTPLGALSVVICAILSSFFLNEKLTFFGWIGCGLCIVGSVVIALNGPQEETVGQINEFEKLFLAPGFLAWGGVLIAASVIIAIFFIPRYGKKSMLWCIFVCSMIGGLSVSTTTGLGSAIVTTIFMHDSQFNKGFFIYILIVFVVVTLITEVYYLNMALAMFNTAMVTPTYYVIFTAFTLITTVVLFQGLKSTVVQILTVVMGFLVICAGIVILQMSKVDPTKLKGLDRRSTMLLQASRNVTENAEKSITGYEDPGMDALRGSFGTVGSIIRARSARRVSQSSHGTALTTHGLRRHQLYDPPVPARSVSVVSGGSDGRPEQISMYSGPPRTPTIKFGSEDVAHYYPTGPGKTGEARHERLAARGEPSTASRQPLQSPNRPGPGAPLSPPPLLPNKAGQGLDGLPVSAPPNDRLFFKPSREDPFEGSPLTAAAAGFSASNASLSYDDEPPHGSHLSPQSKRRLSGSRKYPKAESTLDREESVSLVHNPLERKESEEGESEADTDPMEPPIQPGIRLLSSKTRI